MAEIVWTQEAERWLRDIHDYIANDDPLAAAGVVEGIWRKTRLLAQFPRLGYVFRSEQEGEVRILLYGHYRIAYLSDADGRITVLGVFHGALDIDQYLP